MSIPFSSEELNDAQIKIVKKNNLNNAYIRPICFYGSEGMGLRADNLKVHVCIAAWDWGSYLGDDKITNGIKLKLQIFLKGVRKVCYIRLKHQVIIYTLCWLSKMP